MEAFSHRPCHIDVPQEPCETALQPSSSAMQPRNGPLSRSVRACVRACVPACVHACTAARRARWLSWAAASGGRARLVLRSASVPGLHGYDPII